MRAKTLGAGGLTVTCSLLNEVKVEARNFEVRIQ
jgi:hypothetical protein